MRWVALVVLVGCYSPKIEPGAPCDPGDLCPGGLVCDTTQVPPVCLPPNSTDAPLPDDGALTGCAAAGCPADAPICDNNACRGCVADSECPDDACHELTGTCVADGEIIHVAAGATGVNCTRGQPCGSFDNALNRVSATRAFLKVGDGTYTQTLKLINAPSGVTVVVSGIDKTPDAILAPGAGRGIDTNDGVAIVEGIKVQNVGDAGIVSRGTLTLSHVVVTGSNNQGLDVRQGDATVIGCSIDSGDGIGITLNGGTLDISSSFVFLNSGGGIDYNNGQSSLTVRNTVVANNGSAVSPFGGVRVQALAPMLKFEFNTVVRNTAAAGAPASGFSCNTPSTEVVSSIIADNVGGAGQIGSFCTARFSLFNPAGPTNNNNVIGSPMLDDVNSGYHIQAGSPARDKADPAATVNIDIDGDARPAGGAPDIGADELP